MTVRRLTKYQRRLTCVHEAGHACIHALGGTELYRVAVAPEGSANWAPFTRKGVFLTDLWGFCEPRCAPPAYGLFRWDPEEGRLQVDHAAWRQNLRGLPPRARREAHRDVRARLCAAVAGNVAEALARGEAPEFDLGESPVFNLGKEGESLDDGHMAAGYADLLPWVNGWEVLHDFTVDTLRKPEVWAHVLRLADELERAGEVTEDDLPRFLPDPIPGWPPSPRDKALEKTAEWRALLAKRQ